MNNQLDLSIIIVSYNQKELLNNCLNSILENVGQALKYEIFVVDNNSQDGTLQLLQENFPKVKVIGNTENLGFAKANNQALRLATAKYFVLLNNDTFVLGGCFEKLLEYLQGHPKVGAVSPRLLEGDGQTIQPQGGGNKKQWFSNKPLSVAFISGAVFLLRSEVYKNVGGLDEKFFFYNEDLDWCKRIREHGWEIHYFPESSVIHYGGKSTEFISKRAIVEGIRGGLYYCYKHYRWLIPVYLPLILVYCFLEVLMNALFFIYSGKRQKRAERISAFLELIKLIIIGQYR